MNWKIKQMIIIFLVFVMILKKTTNQINSIIFAFPFSGNSKMP